MWLGIMRRVKGAGIEIFSGPVKVLDFEEPRALEDDELLIDVHAAGVGNWDEIARVGGWDLGRQPPMALGVQAVGVVRAVGSDPSRFKVGDRVLAHSAPFRDQGTWAQQFIVPAVAAASQPEAVPFEAAGGFPVPALTADQALHDGIAVAPGQTVLINGAGGVTGNLLVQLADMAGARVIATASAKSAKRAQESGATLVVDYGSPKWPSEVRSSTGGKGVDAAVNAVPRQASAVLELVRDNGRLATITSGPPASARGIEVRQIYVAPDGARLQRLVAMLASGALKIEVSATYPIAAVAQALEHVQRGSGGGTVVLRVNGQGDGPGLA
jgi:NADPH:quinone reductase-like Zn-dependent oxidoreductase